MDDTTPSPITLAKRNEDHLDDHNLKSEEVVKSLDHSGDRSSVKSLKAAAMAKVNRLSGGVHKLSNKEVSKSHESLASKSNQKYTSTKNQSGKTSANALSKSFSSAAQTEKSKIPKILPLGNNSDVKPTILASHKVKAPLGGATKRLPPKLQNEKNQLDLKLKPSTRSTSKSSINRTESLPSKRLMNWSNSKSSVVASNSASNHSKRYTKSQSARSSSVAPLSCANKRSASNMSTRALAKSETNLRKITSTAGDDNKNESIKLQNSNETESDLMKKPEEEIPKTLESANDLKYKIKTHMDQWFASFKNELVDNNEQNSVDIDEKMEQLQVKQSTGFLSIIDDWCATKTESSNTAVVDKLKKEIEEANKAMRNLEQEHNDAIRQHEEECVKWEKDLTEKAEADLAKKEAFQKKTKNLEKEITSLKTAVQSLELDKKILVTEQDQMVADLKNCRDSIAIANKKLHETEQALETEKSKLILKNEVIKRLENQLDDKNKLELDLAEMTNKLEEQQTKLENQAYSECTEHLKKISELTNKVNCMESDKDACQRCNEKLQQEINDLQEVRENLKETENKLQNLQAAFDNQEKNRSIVPDYSKEVQMELAKYRQLEVEKRQEIDKLKMELSKAQLSIPHLEQQIARDQQLLEVRSGLINSLQANEKTHRIHLEELYAQVGEKTSTINELNTELQTKSEEFSNLFTTLNAKQMELANQEHIIKLLEESNERSQMLRVKQEERISRMEDELARLKQIISIYQNNVLAGNNSRHSLLAPPALPPPSNMEYNENFYYYASQRKRKRQVDINVRKYEA